MKSCGIVSPTPVGKLPVNRAEERIAHQVGDAADSRVVCWLKTTIAYLSVGSSVCGSPL